VPAVVHPGITVPLRTKPLHEHRAVFEELVDLGYTDVWSSEADAHDAFTPLALAAAWAPTLRLGTAIIPAFTHPPAVLAQQIASLADAAPGRVLVGIGASSNVIVERWNGIPFEQPYQRVRDTVRFLRQALAGEKVAQEYETFSVQGFRLGIPPAEMPRLLVAALRPGMLRLAGREGDGAILNWLSPDDVATVVPYVHEASTAADTEIVARIFVIPSADRDVVLPAAKRQIAAYLNVPVYQAFHEWLGRGPVLGDMWQRWAAGDRAGAVEAIPDSVVDELYVWGSLDDCRAGIQRYVDHGVTTTALMILPFGDVDLAAAVRGLSPSGGS
jgi:probable F420-dependent oxidoreductase